jgi:hypothetical protein
VENIMFLLLPLPLLLIHEIILTEDWKVL